MHRALHGVEAGEGVSSDTACLSLSYAELSLRQQQGHNCPEDLYDGTLQ